MSHIIGIDVSKATLDCAYLRDPEIGSKVYAWSPGGAKPPADRSRYCVISAHGVESFITSKFGKPKERIPGKVACQDYALTKLQGSNT